MFDYSSDEFAIPYGDMHPILQRYFNRLGRSGRRGWRDPRHTLARLIAHARQGEPSWIRSFLSGTRSSTGPEQLCASCLDVNIDHNKLAEDIIKYCNIKMCENDIEFYTTLK